MIATPVSAADQVFYEWQENTRNIWLRFPQGLRVAWVKFPEPCIDIVRDKAVSVAVQNGARWIWFVDSDVIPPPDALLRLISHDLPIVAGLYVRRHNPPFNEMLKIRTDGVTGLRPIMDGEYQDGSLVECDAVGTGCVLIRTDVFDKVKPFQITVDGQQSRPAWFLWTEWRMPNGMSEDFSFFVRCRQQGIPVFCDTAVKCKHIGPLKILPSGNNTLAVEFLGAS